MDDDPEELARRLFALLTGQLEDSVTLAVDGQGPGPIAAQHELARALEARVRDAHTIARAIVGLTQCRPEQRAGPSGV